MPVTVEWVHSKIDSLESTLKSTHSTQLIGSTPLELRGFLTAPFGRFKVKYLDEEFRIIETYQGFLACNVRQMPREEWF